MRGGKELWLHSFIGTISKYGDLHLPSRVLAVCTVDQISSRDDDGVG